MSSKEYGEALAYHKRIKKKKAENMLHLNIDREKKKTKQTQHSEEKVSW